MPDGTVVRDAESGELIADLVGVGTRFVAARGGRGGLGNAALASSRRKAPGFALLGEPGEALEAVLELKSVADVALVGYPERRQVLADRRDLRRPARRSPTTRSRRWCPTSAWSRPATPSSRSPTCPA